MVETGINFILYYPLRRENLKPIKTLHPASMPGMLAQG